MLFERLRPPRCPALTCRPSTSGTRIGPATLASAVARECKDGPWFVCVRVRASVSVSVSVSVRVCRKLCSRSRSLAGGLALT